jgi:hypothetical protein
LPWRVYNTTPYATLGYKISKGSKGWTTYQKLKKLNWKLIATEKIE